MAEAESQHFIPLTEFAARFRLAVGQWNDEIPWDDIGDPSGDDVDRCVGKRWELALLRAMANGNFPVRTENGGVDPDGWSSVQAIVALRTGVVPTNPPQQWQSIAGCELHVDGEDATAWLRFKYPPSPREEDFNPEERTVWTIPMVLAWIASRSIATVRWQMSDWRERKGWPHAFVSPIATKAVTDEIAGHPAFFDPAPALKDLRRKCETGEIVATGLASDSRAPTDLSQNDWIYGSLEFDGELRDAWRVGGNLYTKITFRSRAVIDTWPATASAPERHAPDLDKLEVFRSSLVGLSATKKKRLIRLKACEMEFPNGQPLSVSVKTRDARLNDCIKKIDSTMKAATDRQWRVVWREYQTVLENQPKSPLKTPTSPQYSPH